MSFDEVLKDWAFTARRSASPNGSKSCAAPSASPSWRCGMNIGSRVPPERVQASMRLFATRVARGSG
jgi:hypothetical protein